jgi:hypothetical protein
MLSDGDDLSVIRPDLEEIRDALQERCTLGRPRTRAALCQRQDGYLPPCRCQHVNALMPVFQGQVDSRMAGDAAPARHADPHVPVRAGAIRSMFRHAPVFHPGFRVRPLRRVHRVIRGQLLRPGHLLPRLHQAFRPVIHRLPAKRVGTDMILDHRIEEILLYFLGKFVPAVREFQTITSCMTKAASFRQRPSEPRYDPGMDNLISTSLLTGRGLPRCTRRRTCCQRTRASTAAG